jgi:hypothetical protein
MINDLLKLLGRDYTMELTTIQNGEKYVVAISDRENRKFAKCFSGLEAETAEHDVLLCTVEQCILALKENKKIMEQPDTYEKYVHRLTKSCGISYQEAERALMCRARTGK